MNMDSWTGGNKKWVPAPDYNSLKPGHSGQLQGIWVDEGDEVIWNWTHLFDQSYVSGYTIVKKTSYL
jgi:hypothetical protein